MAPPVSLPQHCPSGQESILTLHYSLSTVKANEHVQPTQGLPSECLAMVAMGIAFLGPMGLKQSKREFWAGYHT